MAAVVMDGYTVEQAVDMLAQRGVEISKKTLQRWDNDGILVAGRDNQGARRYTDADLDRIPDLKGRVRKGMVERCREAQSELLAARNLGVVSKFQLDVDGKALKAVVRRILTEKPKLSDDDWGLYMAVYQALCGTTNMVRLRAMGAPNPETLGRRVREILAEQRGLKLA